jgi:hypothetical protein
VFISMKTPFSGAGARDVFGQVVEARGGQAAGRRKLLGHRANLRMHRIADIRAEAASGQVGVASQGDPPIRWQHIVKARRLGRQMAAQHFVQRDRPKVAALDQARRPVGVELGDELRHGAVPVADDMRWLAPDCGDQSAIDHHQPMVVTGHVSLDHDGSAWLSLGQLEGLAGLLEVDDVRCHALAATSCQWLDHERIADPLDRSRQRVG